MVVVKTMQPYGCLPGILKGFILFFITAGLFTVIANAQLTVTVVAPTSGTFGSPVYYEAYASNPTCSGGISAMRIYSAPGVVAYATSGNHIETFISLTPGTYSTVVQAWDNCGNVAKQPVSVTTTSAAGVSVFLPSGSTASAPVHVAASAQGTCSISSMRIYTAPSVGPYTVNSNQTDAFLTLAPGTYNLVAQAWDSCGNVYKTPFNVNVSPASEKYLFATDGNAIQQYVINQGVVSNPNSPKAPPRFPVSSTANNVAVDPGGNFLYVVTGVNITGFQVDHATGKLYPMPGSPFAPIAYSSTLATMDPAGHFLAVSYDTPLYLVTYTIDRSTGALTSAGSIQVPPQNNFPVSLTVNPTGAFAYFSAGWTTLQVYGYAVDRTSAALTPVPGSPYTVPNALPSGGISAGPQYLYVGSTTSGLFGTGAIWGYSMASDGSLTQVPGSPFSDTNLAFSPTEDWFGRSLWTPECSISAACLQGYAVGTFPINGGNGMLGTPNTLYTGISEISIAVESYSGQYLYLAGQQCIGSSCEYPYPPPPGIVGSFKLNSSAVPVQLLGGIATHDSYAPKSIAVSP